MGIHKNARLVSLCGAGPVCWVLEMRENLSTMAAFSQTAELADRPDTLACSGDLLARGPHYEAQRLDIRVPEDDAVVGYGALDVAPLTLPPPPSSGRRAAPPAGSWPSICWRVSTIRQTAPSASISAPSSCHRRADTRYLENQEQ